MASGLNALLDMSRRSLSVQSQALRVIGNNITNANSPNYSRREIELLNVNLGDTTESNFGYGVKIGAVTRSADKYLNYELLRRTSETSRYEVRDEILGRAEQTFALDGVTDTIGQGISDFYSALNDLAANPGSLALRSNVIEAGKYLVNNINQTYSSLTNLQREADNRISGLVTEVNQATKQVATLNKAIASAEGAGQDALALRDERDALLLSLSEKISFSVTEHSNGMVGLSLSNGFALVSGENSFELSFTQAPDFGATTGFDGGPLGSIVYDFDKGNTAAGDMDLTMIIAAGGGELAGLLQVRGIATDGGTQTDALNAVGDIPDMVKRIEAITRDLLTTFNSAYGGSTNPDSLALDGTTHPGAYGLFSATGLTDVDGDGTPNEVNTPPFDTMPLSGKLFFVVSNPQDLAAAQTAAPGDGQNIENLLSLRNQQRTITVGTINPFATNATLEERYTEVITFVGTIKQGASVDLAAADIRQGQLEELRSALSGVSIDEELAKLINFQRSYQAAARLVTTGDTLLAEILNLIQ